MQMAAKLDHQAPDFGSIRARKRIQNRLKPLKIRANAIKTGSKLPNASKRPRLRGRNR